MKTEIIFGINPVFEALKANRRTFFEIYSSKGRVSARTKKILYQAKGIPLKQMTATQLDRLIDGDAHQGIAARVSQYPLLPFHTVLDDSRPEEKPRFFLLLDGIIDPRNLGAIVRTAVCTGVDAVIIPKDRAASPTPVVSKASAGALEHATLSRVTNLTNAIHILKEHHIWIAGLEQQGAQSLFSSDLSGPTALVIGGEGKGIRPLIRNNCDFLIFIPQADHINSLNAATAAAVAMYEGYRQRIMK